VRILNINLDRFIKRVQDKKKKGEKKKKEKLQYSLADKSVMAKCI